MKHPIWIIEDRTALGKTLAENHEDRGFHPVYFQSPKELLDHLETSPPAPAVVILDMELEDDLNGLDLGRKIVQVYSNNPPEFLIYSAHETPEFMQGGYDFGAASYALKGEVTPRQVVTKSRPLYLRWLLKYNWKMRLRHIRSWVWSEPKWTKILKKAFKTFITDKPQDLLAANYLLILDSPEGRATYTNLQDLPEVHKVYEAIEDRVQNHPLPETYQISTHVLESFQAKDIEPLLKDMVFLKIYASSNLKITLGLKEDPDISENFSDIVEAIATTIKPHILETNIREVLHAIESETSRKSIVELTDAFCTNVGERHKMLFDSAVEAGEFSGKEFHTRQLRQIGHHLQQMGLIFRDLRTQQHKIKHIEVQTLIRQLWLDLPNNRQENFTLEGDPCHLYANPAIISNGIGNIFNWMIGRMEHGKKPQPWIKVHCKQTSPEEAIITLSDTSKRLPESLRQSLFQPLNNYQMMGAETQEGFDLFTAKMFIEARGQGELNDLTNGYEGGVGHMLQVKLNSFKVHDQ